MHFKALAATAVLAASTTLSFSALAFNTDAAKPKPAAAVVQAQAEAPAATEQPAATAPAAAAGAATTVWAGVYTADQATRGKEAYDANCSGCHAGNLRGGPAAPGLANNSFRNKWNDKPVAELYTYIHDNMPAGMGGSLSEEMYVDILAYIFSRNEFPEGQTELSADPAALGAITFLGKNPG